MLRKQILGTPPPSPSVRGAAEKDIAAIATVLVTSEDPSHPIDHAFDDQRAPGGSRWIAGQPGEQTVILVFDAPQTIRRVLLDIEEPEVTRVQELDVSVSIDGGETYRELVRQEFNFSPPDTTLEREAWPVNVNAATHLRLRIKPDKGRRLPYRATVTTLALE